MNFVDKFQYIPLSRVDTEAGRRYICPLSGNHLASVTTILSQTGDKSGLDAWRDRVGEEEAKKQCREAAGLGSLMHTHLECHIMNIPRPTGNNMVRLMAKQMADVVIERGLTNVSEVWGIEKGLWYPDLYAGTTDLVGVYGSAPAIMDYKTSKKIKKEEHIEDYKLQIAAYALSHNEIYGTNIRTGVIFMVARDCSYKTFILDGLDFQKACNSWCERVDTWYAQNS
jgi:genome maintenance exonuclease 1